LARGVHQPGHSQSAGTVRLHAFTFASNHFHLLVWARGAALAGFMQYLRANLSRKVGRLVAWSGGFWERRYSAEPVLDEALEHPEACGVGGGATGCCGCWKEEGPCQPLPDTEEELLTDLVAVAIGQERAPRVALVFPGVELDARGRMKVEALTHRTGNPKVWNGGTASTAARRSSTLSRKPGSPSSPCTAT
jgi:hypothetical protein